MRPKAEFFVRLFEIQTQHINSFVNYKKQSDQPSHS